jgi:hypothetical protein
MGIKNTIEGCRNSSTNLASIKNMNSERITSIDGANNDLIKTIPTLLIDKSFIQKDIVISPCTNISYNGSMVNETPISAEVVLKSKSGRSLVNEDFAVTSENIEEFSPTQETINKAIHGLKELGFSVPQTGITLTIVGNKTQFEEVFNIKLTLSRDKQKYGITVKSDREPAVPHVLKDVVEKVVFISPPELLP